MVERASEGESLGSQRDLKTVRSKLLSVGLSPFENLHSNLGQLVRTTSLERILAAAQREPVLADRSANFARRYLGVSVVQPVD